MSTTAKPVSTSHNTICTRVIKVNLPKTHSGNEDRKALFDTTILRGAHCRGEHPAAHADHTTCFYDCSLCTARNDKRGGPSAPPKAERHQTRLLACTLGPISAAHPARSQKRSRKVTEIGGNQTNTPNPKTSLKNLRSVSPAIEYLPSG